MRILLFVLSLTTFFNVFSQEQSVQGNKVYRTYNEYLKNTPFITFCAVKKTTNKKVNYLKINCKDNGKFNIWGVEYENNIWIKDKHKKKFYKLKKDSLGLYYDMYNSNDVSWGTIAGGIVSGVALGVAVVPVQKPIAGLSNVILRYRQDTATNEFYPYGFPYLKPSKVIYYFTKYSKNETEINIEINNKLISLKKGSYYEEVLPSRPSSSKRGIYLEKTPIPFKINIYPSQTTVILFNREKDGSITHEHINKHMVLDFLKKQDKLERITL